MNIGWRRPVGIVTMGVLALAAGVAPAEAHHSTSMYDRSQAITIDAEVKEFRWLNPHAYLTVVEREPQPGTRPRTWVVEMSSPGVLTRSGWTKRTFTPGDTITLQLGPLRSGEFGGIFMKAVLVDGRVVTYSLEPGEP